MTAALNRRGAVALLASVAIVAQAQTPARASANAIRVALIESLSGPFANIGEAVFRNLLWACERVNARGGVRLPSGELRRLHLVRCDSKGQVEGALAALRRAAEAGIGFIAQGHSSVVAAALISAIEAHNRREPNRRMLLLNGSALAAPLTNEACSFWHFRFDAHVEVRMAALAQVMEKDRELQRVYLIGQDDRLGQAVLTQAQAQLARRRPDVTVVAQTLHPVGRFKRFLLDAQNLVASGAQAVVTGNWGSDLAQLVRAARTAGFDGRFYTFYGHALGVPAAIGEAGIGKVVVVADWLPNVDDPNSRAFYRAFRTRFPRPEEGDVHMRMQLMVEALAQSIEKARSTEAGAVAMAMAMESAQVRLAARTGRMRAEDHQFQQSIVVGEMDRVGTPGVTFDAEGSGYGFRIIQTFLPEQVATPSTCKVVRPS